MSIFDQDIQINHEILIGNGWEERYLHLSEAEPNYHCYILKIKINPLKKLRWSFLPTVWFEYQPTAQTIEFLESSEVKPQKVDTISDINTYINFILNHFNYIRA